MLWSFMESHGILHQRISFLSSHMGEAEPCGPTRCCVGRAGVVVAPQPSSRAPVRGTMVQHTAWHVLSMHDAGQYALPLFIFQEWVKLRWSELWVSLAGDAGASVASLLLRGNKFKSKQQSRFLGLLLKL